MLEGICRTDVLEPLRCLEEEGRRTPGCMVSTEFFLFCRRTRITTTMTKITHISRPNTTPTTMGAVESTLDPEPELERSGPLVVLIDRSGSVRVNVGEAVGLIEGIEAVGLIEGIEVGSEVVG